MGYVVGVTLYYQNNEKKQPAGCEAKKDKSKK